MVPRRYFYLGCAFFKHEQVEQHLGTAKVMSVKQQQKNGWQLLTTKFYRCRLTSTVFRHMPGSAALLGKMITLTSLVIWIFRSPPCFRSLIVASPGASRLLPLDQLSDTVSSAHRRAVNGKWLCKTYRGENSKFTGMIPPSGVAWLAML